MCLTCLLVEVVDGQLGAEVLAPGVARDLVTLGGRHGLARPAAHHAAEEHRGPQAEPRTFSGQGAHFRTGFYGTFYELQLNTEKTVMRPASFHSVPPKGNSHQFHQ